MSKIDIKRFEYKYFISKQDYVVLKDRISAIMTMDKYASIDGDYSVRSVYFDTLNNTAYYDKLDGVSKREKIRIRIYNGKSDVVKLEVKKKEGAIVRKISSTITVSLAQKIIDVGVVSLNNNEKKMIAPEIMYILERNIHKPVVIVEYMREAFLFDINNVRITFDKEVRKKEYCRDFFEKNLQLEHITDIPFIILEVKFNTYLPTYISRLLTFNNNHRLAISKYCASREFIY
ncbi:polyphosphate polymerase domain-containing protein [Patescibacteria group bacterium]|nr:polyphosphate polymerase domain-containing protein [Patescibacteria group bacterium]MBU1722120.1 polyphosphate polymerase domain-containing protein [Patescibacteria group bacterium]MBU1901169.1 polyphosphate polymerase domain-containing protein [Patescibacteria group bacterium]